MSKRTRILLLICALILGAFVSLGIIEFGLFAEPDEFSALSVAFATFVGILVSLPLWLPALIPDRFKLVSAIFRWLCAVTLIYPTYVSSSIVENFISRLVQDRGPSFEGLFVGVLLTGLCIIGILALTWPELRQLIPNPSFKRDALKRAP